MVCCSTKLHAVFVLTFFVVVEKAEIVGTGVALFVQGDKKVFIIHICSRLSDSSVFPETCDLCRMDVLRIKHTYFFGTTEVFQGKYFMEILYGGQSELVELQNVRDVQMAVLVLSGVFSDYQYARQTALLELQPLTLPHRPTQHELKHIYFF